MIKDISKETKLVVKKMNKHEGHEKAKTIALEKAKGDRKYIGLAGQRKMFDSKEHKEAVGRGKAKQNYEDRHSM